MKTTRAVEPVFILAGQSNMAGRCSAIDLPEHLNPLNLCGDVDFQMCWDNDHNLGEGCTSNGMIKTIQAQNSPGLKMDIFGPEMALANSLAPRLKSMGINRAYFIKYTMGSTNLHSNWNPSNTVSAGKMADIGYYSRFLENCVTSLASVKNLKANESSADKETETEADRQLWGMFWLQGESDSSKAKDANAYLSNFKLFIDTFRKDLSCPTMPIVVSPVIWHGKKVHVVNEALKQAAESEVNNCVCIEPLDKDEFGVQGADAGFCAGHLTAAGLCEIGRRMGDAAPLPEGLC